MAIDNRMTTEALNKAKLHVYNVTMLGGTVILEKPGSTDRMGGSLSKETLSLKTHPTRFSPFERKITSQIGWAVDVDVVFYISKKQIDDLGKSIIDIERFTGIKYRGRKYEISKVTPFNSFGEDCLYLLIGASK